MTPEYTIYTLWGAWVVSWIVAMLWSNRTEKRETNRGRDLFRVLFCVSVILLSAFPPRPHYYAQMRLWRCAELNIGRADGCRTFVHLVGAHSPWPSLVELCGEESRSPCRRHRALQARAPSDLFGAIFAAFATAIERGTIFALLGVAIVTLAFYIKARREECFLRAELDENAYDVYARKTAMLVPLVRIES